MAGSIQAIPRQTALSGWAVEIARALVQRPNIVRHALALSGAPTLVLRSATPRLADERSGHYYPPSRIACYLWGEPKTSRKHGSSCREGVAVAGIEQSNETPIPVENGTDLLIALLYAPGKTAREGEPITGATRLQKLFFLLREGEGPKRLVEQAREMGFQPYKMGPFSTELRDTVTELEAADILKTERLSYVIPDDRDAASNDDLRDVWSQEMSSVRYVLTDSFGLRVGKSVVG